MKKIAICTAVFLFVLLLTKMANEAPPEPPSGYSFWLYAQQVVQCSPDEITLIDRHQSETHFEKDRSWPDCVQFRAEELRDFHLSRGEKTHYLSDQPTEWWRKEL